jgi:hypothetical protein
MSPAEQEQRILMVLAGHPRQWMSEVEIRLQSGVPGPCYEVLRRLSVKHDITSRKGPGGGFYYHPKKEPAMSGYRGTGRSYNQLGALPDGSAYIIADMSSVGYFRDLLAKMGRDPLSIDFYSIQSLEQLQGKRFPAIDMDHFAREVGDIRQLATYLNLVPSLVHP